MKDKKLRKRDKRQKLKVKVVSDARKHAKKCTLKQRDKVLVKQSKQDKSIKPFNPKPYEIISKKGLMITAEIDDHSVMRDSSIFKHLEVPHKLTNSSDLGPVA